MFDNKKAMWEEGTSPFTLVLGLIVGAFGIIPLLNNLGAIGFNLPFTPTGIALEVIMLVGGIWLLIAGFMEIAGISDTMGWVSVIAAVLVILIGGIPLLSNLGVIGFTLPEFLLGSMISNVIFSVVGIFLILDAFMF